MDVIRNVRLRGRDGTFGVAVDGGLISAVEPSIEASGEREYEGAGNLLLPGFVTETCAVPAEAMSAAGIITLSAFAIGWVVLAWAAPFQFTTAFALNWVPVTVNMKSDLP